jgi:hypothetical protein
LEILSDFELLVIATASDFCLSLKSPLPKISILSSIDETAVELTCPESLAFTSFLAVEIISKVAKILAD